MLDLQSTLSLAQLLAVPVIGYGVRILRDIRDEFRVLNGRVTSLETWKDDHKEMDVRDHAHIRDLLEEMPCKRP